MHVLILYETYSSSTELVASLLSDKLISSGLIPTIRKLAEVPVGDYKKYDLVVFSTPSWFENGKEGQPHANFIKFMQENQETSFLNTRCAFVGLGDSTYNKFCSAIDIVERFFIQRGGILAFPILKLDRYFTNTEIEQDKLSLWVRSISDKNY